MFGGKKGKRNKIYKTEINAFNANFEAKLYQFCWFIL